ncbi:MAG: SigE family RNA polymerase sigma factor [Frankiaceae bacterium]
MAPAGFDEYCAARGKAMLRVAYALTGNVPDAEDLLQTALLKCYRRWDRIDQPDAYVRRVLVRTYAGRRPRREHAAAQLPETVAADPHGVDDRDEVLRLLGMLAPRQRAVLVMRYMLDLSDATIALELGVTESTVRTQAFRALARLRAVRDSDLPTPGATHER